MTSYDDKYNNVEWSKCPNIDGCSICKTKVETLELTISKYNIYIYIYAYSKTTSLWSLPTYLYLIVDSGQLPMVIPLVPPLGSTFPTLSGLLILPIEVAHMQSSRLYCLYWLLCTWCTLGSAVDQELSVRIGQALHWTCQQEFWFDSSGGWVGCWIAEVLWCQMKLVECFEYVGEQMGGHLEHGKFCLDEDAILKRFWLGLPRCWGTLPSKMRHVYSKTYLSRLLSIEYRLRDCSWSQ